MISLSLEYQSIRQKLEQYLAQHPEDTYECAVRYFQYFLALGIKYQELQFQPTNTNPDSFPDLSFSLPLEYQFEIAKLKLYLNKHPEKAYESAIENHEDVFNLMIRYKNFLSQINRKASPFSLFSSNNN